MQAPPEIGPGRPRPPTPVLPAALLLLVGALSMAGAQEPGERIPLPSPDTDGPVSVEAALESRRSLRDYADAPLRLAAVGQLLWAAQGVTDRRQGLRSAPSAGALYPLELYLVAGRVDGLADGVYRYLPGEHAVEAVGGGDRRDALAAAALDQPWVRDGAAVLVFTAVYERTFARYGDRAPRYVHMEAGGAVENVYLQATARGLATVVVGAFRDARVRDVLDLPGDHRPLALVPVGRPR